MNIIFLNIKKTLNCEIIYILHKITHSNVSTINAFRKKKEKYEKVRAQKSIVLQTQNKNLNKDNLLSIKQLLCASLKYTSYKFYNIQSTEICTTS